MSDVDFQLKGSAITLVVLAITRYNAKGLREQLQEKIDQAPQFFANSPILINLEKLENPEDLKKPDALLKDCRELGLQPLGFSGVPESLQKAINASGLPVLSTPNERALKIPKAVAEIKVERVVETVVETVVERVIEEKLVQRQSKVITRPIRSGQQIYAEGADLIVLAQVSEGAEVLADGNIHIYGTLRGRALAGVKGDETARIFCHQLEAELVSIAGNFMLQESLPKKLHKKPAQISLQGDKVIVDSLVAG
jgi:septum site-determining protein MinC